MLLGLYRLGRAKEIDPDQIRVMCDKIENRADCADFDLMQLLWLMWEDRETGLLDPENCTYGEESRTWIPLLGG